MECSNKQFCFALAGPHFSFWLGSEQSCGIIPWNGPWSLPFTYNQHVISHLMLNNKHLTQHL